MKIGTVSWVLGLLAAFSVGCGGDDPAPATDAGVTNADATVATTGGSSNTGGASGSGGTTTSSGGNTTTSSGGNASTTTGGSTDSVPAVDAGLPLPMDGNQGAVCVDGTACNMGLDCVNSTADGQGFCSLVCTTDDDCAGLTGATYTCSTTYSACAVDCMGLDDTTSCPEGMTCQQRTGGAGTFHCQYPAAPPPPPAQMWEACDLNTPCDTDLICTAGNGGFCTATCMLDADCSSPPSGTLSAACIAGTGFGGGGGAGDRCDIACTASDAGDPGCPDGMTCVTTTVGGGAGGGGGTSTSRCRFQ